jgi:hypothetical protein
MAFRRRPHRGLRRHVVALMLLGLLGVAACDAGCDPLSIPSTQRTAEVVGLVDSVDSQRPGAPLIHLASGQTYDSTGATRLIEVGTLEAGSLVLAGTQPTPWWAHMLEYVPGCYAIVVRGRDDGATVVTEIGLRLTKAPGFSAPHDPDGIYDRPNDQFCINREGQVIGYGLIGYGPTTTGSIAPTGNVPPSP